MQPASLLRNLTFAVATASEVPEVLALRQVVYRTALGNDGADHLDAGANHLLARGPDGTVVAAFRFVGPNQRPFPIEAYVKIDGLLASADRVPAYLDRFVIAEQHRSVSSRQFIPIGMLKLAVQRATERRVTDFFILSLPHLRSLYRSAFFRACADSFAHPTWGTVYPMHLDLVALEAAQRTAPRPLLRFLFERGVPGFRE